MCRAFSALANHSTLQSMNAAGEYRWLHQGFVASWEAENGHPLAIAAVLEDDASMQDGRDLSRLQVAVQRVFACTSGVGVSQEVAAQGRWNEVLAED